MVKLMAVSTTLVAKAGAMGVIMGQAINTIFVSADRFQSIRHVHV